VKLRVGPTDVHENNVPLKMMIWHSGLPSAGGGTARVPTVPPRGGPVLTGTGPKLQSQTTHWCLRNFFFFFLRENFFFFQLQSASFIIIFFFHLGSLLHIFASKIDTVFFFLAKLIKILGLMKICLLSYAWLRLDQKQWAAESTCRSVIRDPPQ
jgi:hypothetical protein